MHIGNDRFDILGFGKDTVTGKHKMVWLYNSLELDLDGQTTCEVFDFATNTWRHVTGSTHRILLTCSGIFRWIDLLVDSQI